MSCATLQFALLLNTSQLSSAGRNYRASEQPYIHSKTTTQQLHKDMNCKW